MSRTIDNGDNMPVLAETLERDFSAFAPADAGGQMAPYGGASMISVSNREVTARRVAVPRDIHRFQQQLRQYCAVYGDKYVYSWPVKDNRAGAKKEVRGGTIQLANMLVRLYGNCAVDVDVSENETHWTFKAWFTDLETGFQTPRLFQQRKNQNIGSKYEADRAADMVFQIGQSKAIRNVVLNALGEFRDFALEVCNNAMLERFKDPDQRKKAWDFIDGVLAENGIEHKQLYAVIGKRDDQFVHRDLLKAYELCISVRDGELAVSDAFPDQDEADEIAMQREADDINDKAARKRTRKAKGAKDDAGANTDSDSGGSVRGDAVADSGDQAGNAGSGKADEADARRGSGMAGQGERRSESGGNAAAGDGRSSDGRATDGAGDDADAGGTSARADDAETRRDNPAQNAVDPDPTEEEDFFGNE